MWLHCKIPIVVKCTEIGEKERWEVNVFKTFSFEKLKDEFTWVREIAWR